jgi:hypothetical protein
VSKQLRKTPLTQIEKKMLIMLVERGSTFKQAAKEIGVGENWVWNTRKAEKDFNQACKEASEKGRMLRRTLSPSEQAKVIFLLLSGESLITIAENHGISRWKIETTRKKNKEFDSACQKCSDKNKRVVVRPMTGVRREAFVEILNREIKRRPGGQDELAYEVDASGLMTRESVNRRLHSILHGSRDEDGEIRDQDMVGLDTVDSILTAIDRTDLWNHELTGHYLVPWEPNELEIEEEILQMEAEVNG